MQTFLPPMVRGAGALRSAEPAAGISRPVFSGAAPSRPRPRLPPGEPGTEPRGGRARRFPWHSRCSQLGGRQCGAALQMQIAPLKRR